jgi:hypothetical protein
MRFLPCLLLVFLFAACSRKKFNEEIAPPFKALSIAPQKLEIDGSRDTLLTLSNGSSLTIPANAFVNTKGDTVKGKISLEYKEFHTAADIIASGIPMRYEDEKGKAQQMESAGMFEIRGKANNQDVFIAEGKKLGVNLASGVNGEYDFFYLEEEGNKQAGTLIPSAYAQNENKENKKVRWTRLTNNTDTENQHTTSNEKFYSLLFDTAKYEEAKALQQIKWRPWADSFNRNPLDKEYSWVSKEKWEIADITRSNFPLILLNETPRGRKGSLFSLQMKDSNTVVLQEKHVSIWNYNGKKIAQLGDSTAYLDWISNDFKCSDKIFTDEKERYLRLWTSDGKLMRNFGKNARGFYLQKGFLITSRAGKNFIIEVTDPKGKELYKKSFILYTKSFIIDSEHSILFDFRTHFDLSADKKHFAIHDENGIKIYSVSDGKLIKSLPGKTFNRINFAVYKKLLRIHGYNEDLIWDWMKEKTYKAPGNLTSDISWHRDKIESFENPQPTALVETDKNIAVWNWETDRKTILYTDTNREHHFWLSSIGSYIVDNLEGNTRRIWTQDGKLLGLIKDWIEFSDEFAGVLVDQSGYRICYDDHGKIRKNFGKDSSITAVSFGGQDKLISLSLNGTVCIWDKNGKLVKSFNAGSTYIKIRANKKIIFLEGKDNMVKLWNYEGNFLGNIDAPLYALQIHSKSGNQFMSQNYRVIQFWQTGSQPVPAGIYQLTLRNSDKSFITYVKLSSKEMKLVEQYKAGKEVKLLKEEKREASQTALIRSFEISKFGIYNWDRFYKEENVIQLAADFDLGSQGTLYQKDMSIFLIAGQEQNTIIKYPKEAWGQFSFDPAIPNRLLAVLPDDQAAIFNPDDFNKLDKEALKKNKKFTFKMQVLNKVESLKALNEILKKPEVPS